MILSAVQAEEYAESIILSTYQAEEHAESISMR
jgi:hypothetical protein